MEMPNKAIINTENTANNKINYNDSINNINLSYLSNHELAQRLETLVRSERKITHLILLHINEIDSRRLYAEQGYDSMFSYLTKYLGYSESGAYRRLQSARLLKDTPGVANKLESGALNLSQLTQVQKYLREEKHQGQLVSTEQTQKILIALEHKNAFETEKVLAVAFNKPAQTQEIIRPQSNESVRVEITFTTEEFKEFEQVKNLLSHTCYRGEWKEVILVLTRKYIRSKIGPRKDTKVEASFADSKVIKSKNTTLNSTTQSFAVAEVKPKKTVKATPKGRPYLSNKIKRALFKKAQYKCQYKNGRGYACNSTYQLQIDHIFPKALGGGDQIENLRVLCRTHNQLHAQKWGLTKTQEEEQVEDETDEDF